MIRIANIDECWNQVKPGLEEIKAKTDADWLIEDVRELCRSGEWMLFIDTNSGAFATICLNVCPYSGKRRMEITCAHAGSGSSVIDQYLPFWKRLASSLGVSAIDVRSPRKGFERKGFTVVDIVYRMEVSHELVS